MALFESENMVYLSLSSPLLRILFIASIIVYAVNIETPSSGLPLTSYLCEAVYIDDFWVTSQ